MSLESQSRSVKKTMGERGAAYLEQLTDEGREHLHNFLLGLTYIQKQHPFSQYDQPTRPSFSALQETAQARILETEKLLLVKESLRLFIDSIITIHTALFHELATEDPLGNLGEESLTQQLQRLTEQIQHWVPPTSEHLKTLEVARKVRSDYERDHKLRPGLAIFDEALALLRFYEFMFVTNREELRWLVLHDLQGKLGEAEQTLEYIFFGDAGRLKEVILHLRGLGRGRSPAVQTSSQTPKK